MATFNATVLTSGGSDTDAASYTTASITPTAGALVIAVIHVYDAGGEFQAASVTGNSITWTNNDAQGFLGNYLSSSYGVAPSNVSTGAITFNSVTSTGQTADGAVWLVVECTGIDKNSPVLQRQAFNTANRTTADTLSLPALTGLAPNPNACMAFFGSWDNAGGALDFTEEAGWTMLSELSQAAGGDTIRICCVYDTDTSDDTASASVSAANDRLFGTAFEIAVESYPYPQIVMYQRKPA